MLVPVLNEEFNFVVDEGEKEGVKEPYMERVVGIEAVVEFELFEEAFPFPT